MDANLLVTGSCGLIGSEVASYFASRGFTVTGIDNNFRAKFFGPEGDTRWALQRLQASCPDYRHVDLDIRNRRGVSALVKRIRPSLIVHAAAQPSHDRAAAIPFLDFEVNAAGTLNLLQAARRWCPESPFVYMSTNKVYGDLPNTIPVVESRTRWDFAGPEFQNGIPETLAIDQSRHSLFGASKLAADIMVQEYARSFNLPACTLRAGCLTGPKHSGVELHGFLSYLVRCNLESREYNVFGYKGKQVRDNLHSEDVAAFIYQFYLRPRAGEVYNIGGGKANSCSILEAFSLTEAVTGKPQRWAYVEDHRGGDHICYYSDLRKIRSHYPGWDVRKSLAAIIGETATSWSGRLSSSKALSA